MSNPSRGPQTLGGVSRAELACKLQHVHQHSRLCKAGDEVVCRIAWQRLDAVADIQAWLGKIVNSEWWQRYELPRAWEQPNEHCRQGRAKPPSRVIVLDGRGRRNAAGLFGEIRLPRWSRWRLIVLHEFAHAIQNERPAHGRQFTPICLDLVRRWIGQQAYRQLRGTIWQYKVEVSWWRRPSKPGGNPGPSGGCGGPRQRQ